VIFEKICDSDLPRLVVIGFGSFIFGHAGRQPEKAWQAYLINFLLWSAIVQGGLLFPWLCIPSKSGGADLDPTLSSLLPPFSCFLQPFFICYCGCFFV